MLAGSEARTALTQEIDAAQHQVHRGFVELILPGPEPFKAVFQVMGQDGNILESHHSGRSLDGMNQPKCFVQIARICRISFQGEHCFNQIIELFLGLVEKRLQIL